jgi:aspartyl/asparaginyl-tRNA synthetase
MIVTRVNKIADYENQAVKLNGWVYNSRRSGKIGFLMYCSKE